MYYIYDFLKKENTYQIKKKNKKTKKKQEMKMADNWNSVLDFSHLLFYLMWKKLGTGCFAHRLNTRSRFVLKTFLGPTFFFSFLLFIHVLLIRLSLSFVTSSWIFNFVFCFFFFLNQWLPIVRRDRHRTFYKRIRLIYQFFF